MNLKTLFALAPLTLAAGVFLAACGGGSDDGGGSISASTPAKFGSTDDAAVLVGAFGGSLSSFDAASFSGTSAKAKGGNIAKSFQPKATTTENCDSGSVSFTDDTTTAFTEDGTTVASNCRNTSTSGSSSFTDSINGKSSEKCTDSRQTASVCNASTSRIADGANGSTTLDFAFSGNEAGERFDVELKIKADASDSLSGSTESSTVSGTVSINDKVEKLSATALFDNVRSSFTSNASTGGGSETINGAFGFSANISKCSIGKVTVRTDSPLIYNSNFDTTAGQLTLTDGSGQTARISFNSDGSFTVTLANGQTRTYAADSFDDLC